MSEAVQTADFLTDLQNQIVDLLQADPQLSGPPHIAVLKEDLGDIEAEVQKAIGAIGSGGGVIIVSLPEVQTANQKIPDLVTVNILIQCKENTIVNRSTGGNKVQSPRLAEVVMGNMQGHVPTNGFNELCRTSWEYGRTEDGLLGAAITFTTSTMLFFEAVNT